MVKSVYIHVRVCVCVCVCVKCLLIQNLTKDMIVVRIMRTGSQMNKNIWIKARSSVCFLRGGGMIYVALWHIINVNDKTLF